MDDGYVHAYGGMELWIRTLYKAAASSYLLPIQIW